VLPGELDEARFVTDSSPNSMKKMLRSWPLAEQRRFFEEELGVPLRLERESGKLFPRSDRARDVRDALVAAAAARGVEFRFGWTVAGVEPRGGAWQVRSTHGEILEASTVILATGGLSVPKTGSDGAGLTIARSLGHRIHEPYAALTPLVCDPPALGNLAGLSLDVTLTAPSGRQALRSRGGFLFTHRGYSGPAVLDVSHLAVRSLGSSRKRALPVSAVDSARAPREETERQHIYVQWTDLDGPAWEKELAPRRAGVLGVVRAHLPGRLAEALVRAAKVPEDRSLAELRSDERRRLIDALTRYDLPWTGHEGYRTAEVTGGGVALSEVDPRTMESRTSPGLFLCGEILDAFGPIGGYNFLWAWATGRAAGQGARQRTVR
jgi:predicted Rossmann fold flavoprotein